MRIGSGDVAKVRIPKERSSRRVGWTDGPSLRLAGGEAWHLPKVDDALIPVLPRIVEDAGRVARELVGYVYRGQAKPVGFEGRLVRLVIRLLQAQYKGRDRAIEALIVNADGVSLVAMFDVVDRYLADLLAFAPGRTPTRRGPDLDPSAN